MNPLVKKVSVSMLLLFIAVFSVVTSYAASLYIVHNGKSSEGWYGEGSFNLENCGYDGSSYSQYVTNDSSVNWAYGNYTFSIGSSSYYDYAVYIPDCAGTANVEYGVGNVEGDTKYYTYISINQINYSNQWVALGQWYNDKDDILKPSISTSNYYKNQSTSKEVVWDEAKLSN